MMVIVKSLSKYRKKSRSCLAELRTDVLSKKGRMLCAGPGAPPGTSGSPQKQNCSSPSKCQKNTKFADETNLETKMMKSPLEHAMFFLCCQAGKKTAKRCNTIMPFVGLLAEMQAGAAHWGFIQLPWGVRSPACSSYFSMGSF